MRLARPRKRWWRNSQNRPWNEPKVATEENGLQRFINGAGTMKACCSKRLSEPFQDRYWVR